MQKQEDFAFLVDAFLRCFTEYDYIVDVKEGKLPFNAGQAHVHGTLKCVGCVVEIKRLTHKAAETMIGCERSLSLSALSISICEYLLLAFSVEMTVASLVILSIRQCVISSLSPNWLMR